MLNLGFAWFRKASISNRKHLVHHSLHSVVVRCEGHLLLGSSFRVETRETLNFRSRTSWRSGLLPEAVPRKVRSLLDKIAHSFQPRGLVLLLLGTIARQTHRG